MKGYFTAMNRYFEISGRTGRREYWQFEIVFWALILVGMFIDNLPLENAPGPVTLLIGVVHLVPSITVAIRRLRDAGRDQTLAVLLLVPGINVLAALDFGTTPSKYEKNRYFPDSEPPTKPGTAVEPQAGPQAPHTAARGAQAGHEPQIGTSLAHSPAVAPEMGDRLAQLERLVALRDSGALDDDEYRTMKAELVGPRTGREPEPVSAGHAPSGPTKYQ